MALAPKRLDRQLIQFLAEEAVKDVATTNVKSQVDSERFVLTSEDIAAGFVDLTLEPITAECVQVFIEGGPPQTLGEDFDVVSNGFRNQRISFLPDFLSVLAPGDVLQIYYNVFESLGFECESFTLTQAQIDASEVILQKTPAKADCTQLFVEGGPPQIYGDDFVVANNSLTYAHSGLRDLLTVGDNINVYYFVSLEN